MTAIPYEQHFVIISLTKLVENKAFPSAGLLRRKTENATNALLEETNTYVCVIIITLMLHMYYYNNVYLVEDNLISI